MIKCKNCNKEFPNKIKDKAGEVLELSSRKFCLSCSEYKGGNSRSYIVNLKKDEAFCARCLNRKNIKEFYIRKSGTPYSYCIECQNKVKDIKFNENLEEIIIERGGSCEDCNLSYPYIIYEFYNGKKYTRSKLKGMSLKKMRDTLKNYDLLCKNCCAMREWIKN